MRRAHAPGTYGGGVTGKLDKKLSGRRILITGAARGIGAALAQRLSDRGAHVGLIGLEPDLLEGVATQCGGAPWHECDVAKLESVHAAVDSVRTRLDGIDVVVANAGIAAQLPLIEGDPEIFRRTIEVNLTGAYNTIYAAAPHIAGKRGYFLLVSSLAAVINLPLVGAYSASKAGVEALGNTLRTELHPTGARVGVAYFGRIDTDMTSRGFGTDAAHALTKSSHLPGVAPLESAITALERGIASRARVIAAPSHAKPLRYVRPLAQRVVDLTVRRNVAAALEVARTERAPLTTPQPE
nr:SDR family NAD(P)-dependent oxidoreductase [Hoyosella altamirensis]